MVILLIIIIIIIIIIKIIIVIIIIIAILIILIIRIIIIMIIVIILLLVKPFPHSDTKQEHIKRFVLLMFFSFHTACSTDRVLVNRPGCAPMGGKRQSQLQEPCGESELTPMPKPTPKPAAKRRRTPRAKTAMGTPSIESVFARSARDTVAVATEEPPPSFSAGAVASVEGSVVDASLQFQEVPLARGSDAVVDEAPRIALGSDAAVSVQVHGPLRTFLERLDDVTGTSSMDAIDRTQRVRDLKECFAWFFHFLQRFRSVHGDDALWHLTHTLVTTLKTTTVGTAFSGIDSPGTALETIASAIGFLLGRHVERPPHLWSIEWLPASQYELVLHPGSSKHKFSNISDFYQEPLRIILARCKQQGQAPTYEDLKKVVLEGKAVQPFAWCYACEAWCSLDFVKHLTAGSTCRDWSNQSALAMQGDSGDQGQQILHTMAFFAIVRMVRPATWSHENVVGFPDHIANEMCGDLYAIERVHAVSSDYGWPDVRERAITNGRDLEKTMGQSATAHEVSQLFHRHCDISWRQFFVYSEGSEELIAEYSWACGRDSSMCKGPLPWPGASIWEQALNRFEQEQYLLYSKRYPRCLWYLGQDCLKHTQKSGEEWFCTLIRKSHIVHSGEHSRWLVPKELLMSQGFPVTEDLLLASTRCSTPVCSFNLPRGDSMPPRARTATAGQAGDTMNVNVIGSFLIASLAFVTRSDQLFW